MAWHKRRLTKANLLLVVVGNVNAAGPPAPGERRVRRAAGDRRRRPARPPALGGEAARGGRRAPAPDELYHGLFVGADRANPDYPALQLATRMLSERLFEEVRTKRNLTYAVGAGHSARYVGRGNLYVTAVEPDTTLKVMFAEVRRLQREPVPTDRLQETLNVFATNYWVGQETNMGQAQQLGHSQLTGGGWRNALTFTDRLRRVTPADVQRVAIRYLKNARFVVIGDPKKVNRALFTSL